MKSWYQGITFCEESQTFVHNVAQTARQRPLVTSEGGQAGGEGWREEGATHPFPLPILCQHGERGRREGRGCLGHFHCLPHITQGRQLSHSKDDITWQHYWPSDSNKKKKMFLLPDNWQWHPNVPDVSVWISVWVPPTETARAPQQGRLRQGGREASARRGDVMTDVWGWEEAAMGAPGRFAGLDGPGEKTIEKTVSRT